jgi:hypothetical protein
MRQHAVFSTFLHSQRTMQRPNRTTLIQDRFFRKFPLGYFTFNDFSALLTLMAGASYAFSSGHTESGG